MILRALAANEWRKLIRRPAFRVTFGLYVVFLLLGFGHRYLQARRNPARPFSLPDAWREILGDQIQISLFFGAVLLILLVASEFSWRTARQQVIDGLSKEQFFWAKAILIPLIALLFIGVHLAIGGGLALAGTDLTPAPERLVPRAAMAFIGAWLVAFLGYGALALATALAVRGAGSAMGIWFFYVVLGERLLSLSLLRLGGGAEEWIRYLPVRSFNALPAWLRYDANAFQEAARRAAEQGGAVPGLGGPTGTVLLTALAWIGGLTLGSYIWFRRRDL